MADDVSGRHEPTSLVIKVAELRKDVRQLQSHDLATRKDISQLKESTARHDVRLENGRQVFATIRKELDDVKLATTPRPPSVVKIVGLTLALVTAAAGALWGLSNMLRDRPTLDQVESILDQHQKSGHRETREKMDQIVREQYEQRALINQVRTEQSAQNDKLDLLLERIPPRRRRRSP